MEHEISTVRDRSLREKARQGALLRHGESSMPIADNWQSTFGHDILSVRDRQRRFFVTGQTRSYEFRRQQLLNLRQALKKYEPELIDALNQDLGKSAAEAFSSEIGMVLAEIRFHLKHLKKWMAPSKVATPLISGLATSRIYSQARGQVLIVGAWNYPILLTLVPLVGAISAGNTVVLKPSEVATASSEALAHLVAQTFDERHVSLFEGGVELTQALLREPWDYLFFTGSTEVGRSVAEAAGRTLTPCTLELGGKNPCIVTAHANLEIAARRIVFGKFMNAGQTCVAPDYILVEESVHERFLALLKQEILRRYGTNSQQSSDYGRIINERHFDRLVSYIEHDPVRIAFGGKYDKSARFIAPTLLDPVDDQHLAMQDEIFGPILPVVPYSDLDKIIKKIQNQAPPLALYVFTERKAEADRLIADLSFGGGCINDTLMHLTNPRLPFGGIRESGIGAYHGKHTFDLFSHRKPILQSSTLIDPPARYLPFSAWKVWLFRLLLR